MKLETARALLEQVDAQLIGSASPRFARFEREGRKLDVLLTLRLKKKCQKAKVWKSRAFFITLKNAAYGFQAEEPRSQRGRDGLFLVDRDYRPKNPMMTKLFDQFLGKDSSLAEDFARAQSVALEDCLPVRLVSHHLRLLGLLARKRRRDVLLLVDCDKS